MENELKPNEGKKVIIEVDGGKYERLPIRTHLQAAQKELEIGVYKAGRKLVKWFTHF